MTMDWLVLPVFFLGSALGSFANVVELRIDRLRTILSTPSHCPACRHRLAWYDLIPIFSYLALVGRCRHCQTKLTLQYPLVEASLGLLAVLTYLEAGLSFRFLLIILSLTALVILFVHDLKTMLLPDAVVLGGFLVATASFFAGQEVDRELALSLGMGIAVGVAVPGFLYTAGKGKWMGFGDVKLGGLLGAFLGWPLIAPAIIAAFLFGALVSLLLIIMGKKSMHSAIPFGPFLVLGGIFGLFLGERLLSFYDRVFI